MAGAFALGIVGGSVFEWMPPSAWLGGAALGLAGFGAVEWWDRTRLVTLAPLGRAVALALVTSFAGGAWQSIYRAPPARGLAPVAEASQEPTTLRGIVADAPERTDVATRFVLAADTLLGERDTVGVEGKVRVTLQPSPWIDETGAFPKIQQGDAVQVQGPLRRPPGLRNPGGFDYRAYLARRDICCTLYAGRPTRVEIRGHQQGLVESVLVSARDHVRRQLRRYVPSSGGRGVLQALLLGDRSQVTDTQRERFAKTGLMHLLAVSGLHVFLVGMVLYVLLRPILMRFRFGWRTVEATRALLTVVVLGFYMLLTGGRPSVVRAVIMATLFIGGIMLQRSAHSLNTLGVAALLLLGMRPSALFDVGFQLSMAAVGGIVTLNPRFLEAVPVRYRNSEISEWIVSTGTVSAAAILATAPVLLHHFGWVSVAGLLLNMTGIPCTGLALSAAISMSVVGGGWGVAGAAFGSAADLFVQGLLATSRYGAEWFSWAGLRMPVSDPWVLGALVSVLVAFAQWPRPRTRWRWIIVGVFFATASVWADVTGREAEPTLDVVFFDVGQGGATLIKTPGGKHLLVDSGPRSPGGAAAEFTVLPFLDRWGVHRLDAVVITHPDEDHLGGLPTLLREISVGRVIHNGQSADTELYVEVQRLLAEKEVPQRTVRRGDEVSVGSSIQAQVLSPPARSGDREAEERNNASLVLHLAYGAVDVLLPGDIEAGAEQNLTRIYGAQLDSRVAKIPHHGSSTSSSEEFIRAVGGAAAGAHAIVSVGAEGQYGMPHPNVLERWRQEGMTVHSTAQNGAVWMRTEGKKVWEVRWK